LLKNVLCYEQRERFRKYWIGKRTFILGFVRSYSEDRPDGRYLIKSRTAVGFALTECHSAGGGFIPSGCTGRGWTFIGILNGDIGVSK
jgi:hypothetical protein